MPEPPREAATRLPPSPPTLRRHYVKFCDLADFDDSELRARIRDIVPGHEPRAELRRKFWEYAMLTLFLQDVGRLDDDTEVLSVGAGHEEVLFWLTNHVARVAATDIYGEGGFAEGEADASMLTNPQAFAPYEYRKERLDVRKMDARALEFADASFDVVFSLSSIEHFGAPWDVAQAAREVGRVLRPGGYAFVVTECFVGRHPMNSRLVQTGVRAATLGRRCKKATPWRRAVDVFTREELRWLIVRPSGLELMQPLDTRLSAETWGNVIRWHGEGRFEPSTGDAWPHVLLRPVGSAFFVNAGGAAFTSVALALRKEQSAARPV
jgi:SAM-dependent methyltransferase